ncbi:hypothetical protein DV515_00014578 [Chloebia gouldiae]|uniref:EF-hand domain-containing protein n=1 Tax=Chloebia gouldiae TaxID=44316 RepID=A0A3L8RY05_CHLGU|nr:hypothetical protein DV515_00014578 [Chloebia gouldiae]
MSERRAGAQGRRLGSSRRKQLQEGPGEEPPWASEIVQRVQHLLSARDTEQAGVVTRSDMQKLQEEGLPCSREELELVFDGLDAAGTGRLGTEEFTAGLRQFLSSQKAAREHRRRKTTSRRVRLVLPAPALEVGDSEERRHFAAFMEQLGTDNLSEEQEIWQLWVKLRQDEPQLLDNLEDFLAKMRHRIQEARSKKEALELTLNKRVAEHDRDVQQLCEVLEQQIQQERLRLQQQSTARSRQQGEELQRVLDASEREVQRLVTAQMELERRCRSLHSCQQVTSTENQQLEESNRALQQHLQHLHQQLQHTQGHLRTMRATVAWEHMGQPGDRVVAELPIEVPMSPQLSPGKSEKFRSEMRIRLGSQSSESKAKSTHQVVWEMLPAEINLSGAPQKASSAEEDPSPEPLKEEGVHFQSSLLREMNDAIAALSKHLKAQALGAPLADTPCHPWDSAEPQTGPEGTTAHETTPGVLQETLPGHIHHELLEGDLQEEPASAELRAVDVTQAGASAGAGHCTAQEPGAEQGESPEEAQRMLFLQGKGAGVEEMVLNVAEHLGESMEAGEEVQMEVEGAERLQETTAGAKPQLLGEAEEVEISQRENLEAGLGPPEAGQEGVAVGQGPAMDEQQSGRVLGERVQAPGTALQERAEPALGLPGKLETELGEPLEPEPPSWAEAQVGAARGSGVPEVTVAPGPGVLEEERARTEVQPRGETTGSKVLEVLPAQAERAGSSRARGEEEEVEEAEPRETEQQLQGECARGGAGWRGSEGTLEPLAAAVPPTHGQRGVGTDVELMEAQSSTNMELLAEVEADLQVWNGAGSPGTQQGGGVDPGVQLEKDKPEVGQGEEMGAAAVHCEGPSPAETPVGSPVLCGLFPGKSQALELVEADLQLSGGPSPENPQGGKGEGAVQLQENEEEDGAGQDEHRLPQEFVPLPSAVNLGQGEGAGAGLQLRENAESLDTTEGHSTNANVQLSAEGDELRLTPGGSTEADLQPLGEAGSSGTEQGGSVDPEVQPLDQGDKEELLERMAEDVQDDRMFHEGPSPGAPWGGEGERTVQLEEDEEDGAEGQGEHGLPHEPVLDLHRSGVRQVEGADEDMQAQEEAESLDTTEGHSTGVNVQLSAEGDELNSASGERPEADLQPLGEAGSSGTEQGGSVDPEVQPRDQGDKAELVEGEAEDAQADLQLSEGRSSGVPWGGEIGTNAQIEEKDDEAQGQGEHELPHEPVFDLHVSGLRRGEGEDEDMQAQEEAESLDTTEDHSTGVNVQLSAEGDELNSASGERPEADLQPLGEAGSSGTEQGERMDPEVQPRDQGDKAELVEGEAEDAQADLQLSEGRSSGGPWGGEWGRALHNEEDEEGEAQVQGENGLPQESVLSPEGARGRHGEGAGAGAQPQEAAESLHTLEAQSTDAVLQLFTDQQMPKSGSRGSTEADLTPLGVAGLWKWEQDLTLALEAVLGPSPTANPWEGAAAADVPPPTEAALCPEPATPAEGPGLEAKLGAYIGPEGQILEAQELLQGERAPAEGQPLDGAHGLEVAEGERLEAEVRKGVKTPGLGLNQGHDEAALASLVSEVLSQLSPLKLETMMQEDVLIPDVWRLCAPGQAAQRELQEQVSAQGHEGRLHTVAQQPEGETPPAMEPEHTAAGHAEHPKQEVPPASTLHTAVQPGDAGSDQLGVVLRENSLGQRQLLGEQSKDLSVGQREKMQRFGEKMSQDGELSSGEPGAVTAAGAGAAPRGCPKAALDPDHLYNVLFIGDSHVGKTSFLYRLHADTFNPHLTATVGLDYQIKTLVVDNERCALRLWDSAGQERYRSVTKQFFRKADGVVLMYDITSEFSFSDVRYWLSCIQEGAEDGVAVLLLGNKTDCAAQRQVPTKEGECLAKEHQLMFYECSAASGHNVFESMASFTRLLKVREDELKNKAEEVPKAPQKKKGCCW